MVNKRILILNVLFFSILAINLVSAEIMLFQPSQVYNFGDSIQAYAKIKALSEKQGFFEMNLVCGSETINIHKEYVSLSSNQEKTANPSALLITKKLFGAEKECKISASFEGETAVTPSFKISDKSDLSFSLQNASFEPGASFIIQGTAKKENGQKVLGFIELISDDLNIHLLNSVDNGEFYTNITLPENSASKNYVIIANVYEKDKNGEVINQGKSSVSLFITQKPTNIDIALASNSFPPGTTIKFKPLIVDQAGTMINGGIAIKILNSKGESVFEEVVNSGEEDLIQLKNDALPGQWTMETSALDLNGKRMFTIEELKKASFKVNNGSLIITNDGNVLYNEPVQIFIGNESKTEKLNLKPGESKEFMLTAPDGEYDVKVLAAGSEQSFGRLALTGNAVKLNDFSVNKLVASSHLLLWLFLIGIFGIFIFVMYQRVEKMKSFSFPSFPKSEKKSEPVKQPRKASEFVMVGGNVKKAEYALVMDGKKEESALLVLNLKNHHDIMGEGAKLLERVGEKINEHKGAVYRKENFLIGIFAPLTTKTFKNEPIAIKVAGEIEKSILQHNKTFGKKIDFGLALNSGPLALKKEIDCLKFTSIENTLELGKKIASLSNQALLISDPSYKKAMTEVKAKKQNIGGLDVYSVESIVPRENNEKFIKSFLDRQNKDKQYPRWANKQ